MYLVRLPDVGLAALGPCAQALVARMVSGGFLEDLKKGASAVQVGEAIPAVSGTEGGTSRWRLAGRCLALSGLIHPLLAHDSDCR